MSTYVLTKLRKSEHDALGEVTVKCIGTNEQCVASARKEWADYQETEFIPDFDESDYPLWHFNIEDSEDTAIALEVHRVNVNDDGTVEY